MLPADVADDPTYRARFTREAAALAQLDSPRAVQIYDHGVLDGHLHLAVQLVHGADLAELVQRGPLAPRRALRIAEQVAAALGDAHAVGLATGDGPAPTAASRAFEEIGAVLHAADAAAHAGAAHTRRGLRGSAHAATARAAALAARCPGADTPLSAAPPPRSRSPSANARSPCWSPPA